MTLLKKMIAIEVDLDIQMKQLRIWELPFQTIISWLLLIVDGVDRNKNTETAADYCSRLSYIYPFIKMYAGKAEPTSTTDAILSMRNEYQNDLQFLIAYSHFCLLMPQIRRGIMVSSHCEDKEINLAFPSSETEYAEVLDRLYSYISLQVSVSFREEKDLVTFLNNKAAKLDTNFGSDDAGWIYKMYHFYRSYFIAVEVLPSEILEQNLGFSFSDYASFKAVVSAFAEYHYKLSNAYYELYHSSKDSQAKDKLEVEYFENCVRFLDFKPLIGFYIGFTGMPKDKFLKILSYYLLIYDNKTNENFIENAFSGEGYFPPFILFETFILHSPYCCNYMMNFNSILYSINKKNVKLFDEKISAHLEPTLINQLEYLFTSLNGIVTKKNVNYPGGEADLIVYSPLENVCLFIQVKATIAPDSSRTVERVQDRALEGVAQINYFRQLNIQIKQEVINNAFNVSQNDTIIIDLLAVRSCAGSNTIWKNNDVMKIVNYTFLAWIVSEKLKTGDYTLASFDITVLKYQQELINISKYAIVYEVLDIGGYKIKFPNVDVEFYDVVRINFRTSRLLVDFEKSHF